MSKLTKIIFRTVSRGGVTWLESVRLGEFPWLVHAFSTRHGGVSQAPCAGLNLGFTGSDRRERVQQNRRQFFSQLGGNTFIPCATHQVHSSHSFVVGRDHANELTYRLPGVEGFLP